MGLDPQRLSEFDIIYRYLAQYGRGSCVDLSVGDDAAVLSPPEGSALLVSTDTQLEGIHFPSNTLPEHIAYRAIGAAASDLAAMAAEPLAMTLALTLPEADELWLHGFAVGLGRAVTRMNLPLVGGDLTRGPLSLTVTVMGHAPRGQWLSRSGARVGDLLVVTGTLGDAAAGLAVLEGRCTDIVHNLEEDKLEWLEQRFYAPTPRFEWCEWLRGNASAAIDISDGLLADLRHMAAASGVALAVRGGQLPLSPALSCWPTEQALAWALAGGDDYELAFACPADTQLPEGATIIGEVRPGEGVHYEGPRPLTDFGYDHFAH